MPLKTFLLSINKFINKRKQLAKFLLSEQGKSFLDGSKSFFLTAAIHGFFLNYSATIIFGMSFEFYTFIGYGFAWWYLTKEIPIILKDILYRG